MDTIQTILKRRSIRRYTDQKANEETIHKILDCGMSGPTAVNKRDWAFIVVDDKDLLKKWSEVCDRAAHIVKDAAFCVLICGDMERALEKKKEFWIIDGSISGQNMILAATDLGLGSVWLGVWPVEERIKNHQEFFHLPDTIIPHSIIAFGYPDENKADQPHISYEADRVHFNHW